LESVRKLLPKWIYKIDSRPFAWKTKLDFAFLDQIQKNCSKPMHELGYRLIKGEQEMGHPDIQILEQLSKDGLGLRMNPQ
jgi:hypothetical protein